MSQNVALICIISFIFDYANAFTSYSAFNINNFKITQKVSSRGNVLYSGKDDNDEAWDAGTDYPDFDPDEDDDDDFLLNFAENGLGIDIGKQMGAMTPEEIAEIKAEAAEALENAFEGQIKDIEIMKKKMAKDFEKSKKAMDFASELNAQRETEKLMNKIDAISNKFLSENEALRMGTKAAAAADANNVGKGLEIGSWGYDEDGFAVTMDGGAKIGGANSFTAAPTYVNADGEEVTLEAPAENKILIIIDESEKMDKKLVEKFTSLLETSLPDTPVVIETISSSKPAPIGGLDAQTAIFFTSALTDRGSIERIIDRILKRTAPAPGKISAPPTHLVCITSLGTQRTNKMPYSMQNMFSKKLDKKRGMEEAIISTIKRRNPEQCPLDYTIIKIGNIVDEAKEEVGILEGDSLDGDIGVDAAAQVLLQSVAYQPPARNATLSAVGGKAVVDTEQAEWDDMFITLDGPELARIEIPLTEYGEDEVQAKYERLSEYVQEWAVTMFSGDTKGTGLTTPVIVERSRKLRGTQSGVRIVFKQTNTGAAYKSKSEEREIERQSNNYGGTSNKGSGRNIRMAKQKKEGGLEVIVEMKKALPKEGEGMRLRVRGRRCNMADDTVIKEISEGVLVKKMREGIKFWIEQNTN